MKYPYLLTPVNLDDFLNGKYQERITLVPKRPDRPFSDEGFGFFASALMYIGGSVLLLCVTGLFFSKQSGDTVVVIKIIGGAVLAIVIGYFIGQGVSETKKKEFERKLNQYNKEQAAYEKQKNFAQDVKSSIKYLNQSEKLNYLLHHFYKTNTIKPELSHSIYKEGKNEQMFYAILFKYFGENISKDHTIVKDYIFDNNHSNYDVKNVYLPDFIYYNSKSGICIDIEIDERTEKATGKTIHRWNDDNERKRDQFFLKNGWFVLRFAEEQILNNSMGCINNIITLLEKYDPEFAIDSHYKQIITTDEIPNLIEVNRW